ncbi:MAG: DUF2953 domain-containing protein [Clostridia bacterium]|nr:DUF2953 domain-containing protein [Clostridia bacterium]
MTALVIVLSIIAVILSLIVLLLLFGRVKIHILSREKVKIVISVLGIRIISFSNEKKKQKTKSLSRCRHPDRVLKRELRKRRKAARAAMKKREKAKRKALKKRQKREQNNAPVTTPTLRENISTVFLLLKKILNLSRGKLALRVRRLRISVGSDDAAKTAILYGVISQSTAYLLEWAEHNFSKVRCSDEIDIVPDYLSPRCHADIDLICSFGIIVGIRMLIAHAASGLDFTKEETASPNE